MATAMRKPDREYTTDFLKSNCRTADAEYRLALIAAGHLHPDVHTKGSVHTAIVNLVNAKSNYETLAHGLEALEDGLRDKYAAQKAKLNLERARLRIISCEIDGNARGIFTIKRILSEVCTRHGVDMDEMKGTSKVQIIVRSRQEAQYNLRYHTDLTYMSIARIFKQDHSTVVHGVQQHAKRMRHCRKK